MKKHMYLAIMAALPIAAIAQPTAKKAMVFTAGTKVNMLDCNHMSPGAAGANKTWDMSTLTAAGGTTDTLKTEYKVPGTSPFPTANLMVKDADTMITYYNQSANGMYMLGMIDSSTSGGGTKIFYTNSVLVMKQQLNYNMIAADTTADSIYTGGFSITGKGTVNMIVDGYGTIKLPNGTFNNVLRVRYESNQKDSIPPPIGMSFNTKMVSYMWFDDAHRSPLCRIDSTDSDGSFDQSASYLLEEKYPVGVNDVVTSKADFNAFFNGNELVMTGKMDRSKTYETGVFNLSGQKIYTAEFNPQAGKNSFDINNTLIPGIYMVYLCEKNNPQSISVIKVSKQ